MKDGFIVPEDVKIEQSRTLLTTILPFLKQFNQEQISEKEIEAKIQGILSFSVVAWFYIYLVVPMLLCAVDFM